MLNWIWLGMILIAAVSGIVNGKIPEVVTAVPEYAKTAFELALGMTGIMTFWLGIMKIAEKSGLISILSWIIRPLLRRLFPDVPPDHPALGSIMLNLSANMLGLNNAATPFGLKAMEELQSINEHPKIASNAMCTFLAINTSSVQLIPTTAIAFLASAGAKDPTDIIATALFATTCSTIVAIVAVKLLEKLPSFRLPKEGK